MNTCSQWHHTSLIRKCDNLRCTKCDFRVIWFDNYAWSPTVNYIFLRNNVPDFFKLQEKLDPEKGVLSDFKMFFFAVFKKVWGPIKRNHRMTQLCNDFKRRHKC